MRAGRTVIAAAMGAVALGVGAAASAPAETGPTTNEATASDAAAAAAPIVSWQRGVRAGTTRFVSGPNAACRPLLTGATVNERTCKLVYEGRFKARDQPYSGSYSGTTVIRYDSPTTSDYAAFVSGTVTYQVRARSGALLKVVTLEVDSGTGGVTGFPGGAGVDADGDGQSDSDNLAVTYTIEERNEQEGLVLRMNGTGVNELNQWLDPTFRYLDRISYQNGI